MDRKMYIRVTMDIIVNADVELSIDNVMDRIEFQTETIDELVEVLDFEIENFQLIDSK